jgi:hypothetical protein
MFDKIAVCRHGPPKEGEDSADILWLRERGTIFDCDEISDDLLDSDQDEIFPLIVASLGTTNSLSTLASRPRSTQEEQLRQALIKRYWHIQVRISTAKLRNDGFDPVPVLEMHEMVPLSTPNRIETAVRVVLNAFPQPDDETGLDEILRFREDERTVSFAMLREWMYVLTTGEVDPTRASVALESLVGQYEEALKIAKIRFRRSALEAVCVSTSEILEDLIKIKWSAAVKGAFGIFKENADFLEAEQKAPGRAIAYVAKARRQFGE